MSAVFGAAFSFCFLRRTQKQGKALFRLSLAPLYQAGVEQIIEIRAVGQGADAIKVMAVVLRCVGTGVDQASVFIAAFLRQYEDIGFFNEIEAFAAASSLTR